MDNTQSPIMLRKESLGSTVNGPQSSDKSILYLEDLQCLSADACQSPSEVSLVFSEASSASRGRSRLVRNVEGCTLWKTKDRVRRAGKEIRVTRSGLLEQTFEEGDPV